MAKIFFLFPNGTAAVTILIPKFVPELKINIYTKDSGIKISLIICINFVVKAQLAGYRM